MCPRRLARACKTAKCFGNPTRANSLLAPFVTHSGKPLHLGYQNSLLVLQPIALGGEPDILVVSGEDQCLEAAAAGSQRRGNMDIDGPWNLLRKVRCPRLASKF